MEVDLVVLVDVQVAARNELILELLEVVAGLCRVGVGHGGRVLGRHVDVVSVLGVVEVLRTWMRWYH